MATEVIHAVGYAAHNDVSLLCAAPLTFRRLPVTVREGVYEGDDGVLYSFDEKNTSCVECLRKQRDQNALQRDETQAKHYIVLRELRTAHAMMWELLVWLPLAPMARTMRDRTTTFLKDIKDLVK